MLGHAHPAVVEAVQKQIEIGIQYGAGCDLAVEWAELIQKLVPSAEWVEFMDSGTEAIMYGDRLSGVFTKRSKVVRFQFHFAGAYDAITVGYKRGFHHPRRGH